MSFRLRKHSTTTPAAPLSAVVLSNESQELYAEMRAGYRARFQPADQVEADLVDRVVACQWRLQRTVAMGTAAINLAMQEGDAKFTDAFGPIGPVMRAALAIHTIENTSGSLYNLQRSEGVLSKRYGTALRQLMAVQQARKIRQVEAGKDLAE